MRLALLTAFVCISRALKDLPAWGDWNPKTDGWRQIMDRRARQIMEIADSQERWDALNSFIAQSLMVRNYTKQGYAVVKSPPATYEWLRKMLHDGLRENFPFQEGLNPQIWGESARHVDIGHAGRSRLLQELQPMHEEWGGVQLVPSVAFGMRVYVGGNSLTMHVDRTSTHVISSIFHIDRDLEEPWPIVIEGLDGVTAEVALEPGEMLFYESSKCLHGRPRPMKGRWYASVFVHYKPMDYRDDIEEDTLRMVQIVHGEAQLAHENGSVLKGSHEADLRLTGTGFYEPGCPHGWCTLSSDWLAAAGTGRAVFTFPNASHHPQSAVLATPRYSGQMELADTVSGNKKMDVEFVNLYGEGASLYFVGDGGDEILVVNGAIGKWPYESSIRLSTSLGHRFDARDGGRFLQRWYITAPLTRYVLTPLHVHLKNAYKDGVSMFFVTDVDETLIHDGQGNEWPYGTVHEHSTYPGHTFEAREGGRVLASWTMMNDSDGQTFVIEPERGNGGRRSEL
eukprot:TRINITY_DN4569_c0_g1_i1.p1 TRINITY_DN4569_c0_g1~~TRINITY_DN4569_c0_g1_i1.p1  ORF type:complete len:510 (-),score=61.39 TRINITY_DN4569_c0_g1_i1:37-1566(-)